MLGDVREVTLFDYPWWVMYAPLFAQQGSEFVSRQILLEFTWMIPKVGKDQIIKGHLAWANGDTTGEITFVQVVFSWLIRGRWALSGYGMHADFING